MSNAFGLKGLEEALARSAFGRIILSLLESTVFYYASRMEKERGRNDPAYSTQPFLLAENETFAYLSIVVGL